MSDPLKQRLHIDLQGSLQGVGFRPFVYQLAQELHLAGGISNTGQGVRIDVEGNPASLERFLLQLDAQKPPGSGIHRWQVQVLDSIGYKGFEIRASTVGQKTAWLTPDLATCTACLEEVLDPANRRYRYPFTNCTHCGPRFSVIEDLPYDRANTTLKHFVMCADCQTEYADPLNRRFHAQPNACPACGPHLELWDQEGQVLARQHAALLQTVAWIRQGKIVAVKGLGGFHLLVDASQTEAVQRLRQRKHRPAKPLAVMAPSLTWIQAHCQVSDREAEILQSAAAPIMLLRRRSTPPSRSAIAVSVAPNNPDLGILLPYTPLHHLLMHELGSPVVATSGNRTDEPMCTDEYEALQRLTAIADGFLVHNRPIARSMEDSVVRVIRDREVILRRARGYAPTPILTPPPAPPQRQEQVVPLLPAAKSCVKPSPIILAMGAQLKTTIAFYRDHQVFLSQHIGDLGSLLTMRALQAVIEDFQQFYDLSPTAIACDLHPDYESTRLAQQWAHQKGIPLIPVQHHYAHVLACMADNQLQSPVLGIAWDGTGYGFDHTLWGSEFLLITESSFRRLAHMRSFPLPGGEKAAREPRRSAMGLLFAGFGDAVFERQTWHPVQAFTPHDLRILSTLLKNQIHSPLTCSVGRLFDAIASLIGLRQTTQFEGQAAMDLEFCAEIGADDYRFEVLEIQKLDAASPLILDWMPMVQSIVADLEAGVSIPKISAKFHKTLVEMILAIAKRVGVEQVVLTGGCFQNKLLTAAAISALRAAGFRPYCHRQVPPNDGGIALGQIMAALRHVTGGE